tara:strand:+ start:209 stop:1117 length:909 start_codon:yes stop_codon:yes gene_type:complete
MKKSKDTKKNIKNWSNYNRALMSRGSLNIWIDEQIEDIWYEDKGKRIYTDKAIEIVLTLKFVYKLPLRQTIGLIKSVFSFMDINLDIPDYTTISRRAKRLNIKLQKREKKVVDLVLDSTGAKVFGEGEWKVRKHGWSKRRTWRKLHIGIDVDGEIRSVITTKNNVHDSTVVDDILRQEGSYIRSFYGDGAYDSFEVYMSLKGRDVKDILVPPNKNAKIRIHGNSKDKYPRDENLRKIRKSNKKQWKINSGYHKRSLGETVMYRFKNTFGGNLSFREDIRQETEVIMKCNILNVFSGLGMPSY